MGGERVTLMARGLTGGKSLGRSRALAEVAGRMTVRYSSRSRRCGCRDYGSCTWGSDDSWVDSYAWIYHWSWWGG